MSTMTVLAPPDIQYPYDRNFLRRMLRRCVPMCPVEHMGMFSYTVEEILLDEYGLLDLIAKHPKDIPGGSPAITTLDIGANFGLWTLAAKSITSKKSGGPSPRFDRNILIEPVPTTLATAGTFTDFEACEYGCHAMGCGEPVELAAGLNPMVAHASTAGRSATGTYAMPFSRIIEQYELMHGPGPIFIKIDCEGGEKCLLFPWEADFLATLLRQRKGAVGIEIHLGKEDKYYQPRTYPKTFQRDPADPRFIKRDVADTAAHKMVEAFRAPDIFTWKEWLDRHFSDFNGSIHHERGTTAVITISHKEL